MPLKNSIKKTKIFLNKSLQSLRSFLFGSYQNIPNTLIINPLSCTNVIPFNTQHLHRISSSNQWEHECLDLPPPNTVKIDMANLNPNSSLGAPSEPQNKPELATGREEHLFQEATGSRSFRLVQKMKVLEMMNVGEVDHALDVEEALHYYSRLTCPVYVDIVDKFFMDMYRDYYFPQLSISLGSVSQRLSSSRRLNSSRRLGSSRRLAFAS